MKKCHVYIFIIIILFLCVKSLQINKESYENKPQDSQRPPGPWGNIGTGKPWYDYPYILHNIEYY
jgi:hypothetical protein